MLCHWKSNSHLSDAMAGKTDLDILVAEQDREKLKCVLSKLDFKKMIPPIYQQYPGMEDYLGLDSETGELVHLHVHYELIIGRKKVKNHHLPLERFLLERLRNLDGVPVPLAEVELLLLAIRAHMKTGVRDIARCLLRKDSHIFPPAITNEFAFLLANCTDTAFLEAVKESGLPLSSSMLLSFIKKQKQGNVTWKDVLKLRRHIFVKLAPFRRYSAAICLYRRIFSSLRRTRIVRWLFPLRKKTLKEGGHIFALVGADGSGKSTIVRDLRKWLSWKVETKTAYFGKQRTPAIRFSMSISNLFARFGPSLAKKRKSVLRESLLAFRWLLAARNKHRIYRHALQCAIDGSIVIADRFPLPAFNAMACPMDVARIRKDFGGQYIGMAAREESHYAAINPPDRIFVLQTSVEELLTRKNSLLPKRIKEKAEAVNAIMNDDGICLINGNRMYAEVLLEIKKKIWSILS